MRDQGQVTVTFHGDLRDFLPAWRRGKDPAVVHRAIYGRPAAKDVLEAVEGPAGAIGELAAPVEGEVRRLGATGGRHRRSSRAGSRIALSRTRSIRRVMRAWCEPFQ